MTAQFKWAMASLCVTLACEQDLHAQGSITWGTAPGEKNISMDRSICSESECYLFSYDKKQIVLTRVDEALKETARTEIKLTYGKSDLVWYGFHIVGDKLVAFGYRNNKETKSHELLTKAFNRETLASPLDWGVVAAVTESPTSLIQPFQIRISPTRSKVLITCPLYLAGDMGERMSIHVLNNDLMPQWSGVFLVPAVHFAQHEQGLIDEEGNAYFLYRWNGTKQDAEEFTRSRKPYGGYCLIRFGVQGARDSVFYLNKDHFMLNMKVTIGERGEELFGAAFYSLGITALCRGATLFSMNPKTMEETDRQHMEFADEFLKRWLSDDEEKRYANQSAKWCKGKFHGLAYSVHELKRNQDGSVTMVAEQTAASAILGASQRAEVGDPAPVMETSFDVAVVRFSPEKGKTWVAGIPKRQYHRSTLITCSTEDGAAVVYNDRRANLEAKPGTELKHLGAKSQYDSFSKPDELTMVAWVSTDGNIVKNEFALPDKGPYNVFPSGFNQFGEGRMLVKAISKKGIRYGVMRL